MNHCMQKRFFKIFTFCFLAACGGSGNEVIYTAPSFMNDYSVLSIKEGIRNIEIINASDTNNRDITLSISDGVDQEFFLIDINGHLYRLKKTPDLPRLISRGLYLYCLYPKH